MSGVGDLATDFGVLQRHPPRPPHPPENDGGLRKRARTLESRVRHVKLRLIGCLNVSILLGLSLLIPLMLALRG